MKIILSPAKKMNDVDILFTHRQEPILLNKTQILKEYLCTLNVDEISKVMKCNEKIASLTYQRYQSMNLSYNLSPALFTYEGLAYQHLGAHIMTQDELEYLEKHLYILSGFYGVLRPFDGIRPYRLEMQTKLDINEEKSLYSFWKDEIAKVIFKDNDLLLNLASNEYSSCITPYLNENQKMITCIFAQRINGKLKTKGTEAKMCRGAMVRYMAENHIEDLNEIKKFEYLGYIYDEQVSNENEFVYVKD